MILRYCLKMQPYGITGPTVKKGFTLVLGGAGFLGSWIVRELRTRDIPTVVLCRHPQNAPACSDARTEYVVGDCSDAASLRKVMARCHAVIHAAGYYPMFSLGREQQAQHAMQELRTVLRTAHGCDVQKFVFTSSPMVLVEDPSAFRRCTYHYIKKMMHDEVLRWVDLGLPAVLAIPGACFGPGDRKPTTGRVILEIVRGRLRVFVEGKLNSVDARDVAFAEVEMLTRGAIGQSYQLGNWNGMVSEFVSLVARIRGIMKPAMPVTYEAARFIARTIETIQYPFAPPQPLFPESGVDQVHYGTHLDSSLAVRTLGFTTRPIGDTIRETIEYFEREGMIEHRVLAPSVIRINRGESTKFRGVQR